MVYRSAQSGTFRSNSELVIVANGDKIGRQSLRWSVKLVEVASGACTERTRIHRLAADLEHVDAFRSMCLLVTTDATKATNDFCLPAEKASVWRRLYIFTTVARATSSTAAPYRVGLVQVRLCSPSGHD